MMGFLRRARAVAVVESLQLLYDPATLVLIFLLPVFQILLYGSAIRFEPRGVPIAVASSDADLSAQARAAMAEGDLFRQIGPISAPGSATAALARGDVQVAVELARNPRTGAAQVAIAADGSDPAEVRPAVGALEAGVWRRIAESAVLGQKPTVAVDWRHDPQGHPAWRIAPGLVGVIVMITMLFLGALTLVRERERGSWETLLATPVRPTEALVGKLSPYLVIGLVQTLAMLGLIHALFAVPLPASGAAALLTLTLVFDSAYLLLGFAISAVVQTQLQAVQAAVFVYLPSLLLCGFLFPFDGMPPWAQAIGEALPITHYVRATREALLRGDGAGVWSHMPPMLAFAAVAFAAAVTLYRRRLD
jgi:ABC-2 type transport system permease protein